MCYFFPSKAFQSLVWVQGATMWQRNLWFFPLYRSIITRAESPEDTELLCSFPVEEKEKCQQHFCHYQCTICRSNATCIPIRTVWACSPLVFKLWLDWNKNPSFSAHCKQTRKPMPKSKPLNLWGKVINVDLPHNLFLEIITSWFCITHSEVLFPSNYEIKRNVAKSVTRQSKLHFCLWKAWNNYSKKTRTLPRDISHVLLSELAGKEHHLHTVKSAA